MNLLSPLATDSDAVRLIPLGGLGEIGMNMMAIEAAGKLVIIDCGLMFPEAHMLGIDLVIPDVASLAGRADDILAILLTHGHEDHIGAIPYLLEALGNPPIYGTPLTLGLLQNKLREHQLAEKVALQPVTLRQELERASSQGAPAVTQVSNLVWF